MTKEVDDGLLREIIIQLQLKYKHFNEIYNLTKSIGDSLSRDDRISVQMLLEMRQEEIAVVNNCDKSVGILSENLSLETQDQLQKWFQGNLGITEDQLGQDIVDVMKSLKALIKKCMELDKGMSMRVAGKESFYR